MNKKTLALGIALAFFVALPLSAVQVWFSSAPGSAAHGQSYYVEAQTYIGNWWEPGDIWLYKNNGYVSGNWGSYTISAGTWQTDSGPQWIEYFAEAWDWSIGENAMNWHYVYIEGPLNQAPMGICDYSQSSVPRGANLQGNGWAADNEMGAPISRVDILVNGNDVGDASLGGHRPDVASFYGRSDYTYSGWSFSWNTGGLPAGTHSLEFRAWDNQGASTTFGYRTFTVTNSSPSITLLSPSAQTTGLGSTLTITSNATDGDGNIVTHNLDIQRPDGTWNWQGGFAYGEPYMGGPVGSAANSTRSANFTFNQPGTWYVRSWVNDANSNNLHSATVAIVVADLNAPTTPTGLGSSNVTPTTFTLSWTASSDNVGVAAYQVFRDSTNLGESGTTSMNIAGLSQNTTYGMKVRARDAAGNWSAWSSVLSVTTTIVLTPPSTVQSVSVGSAFATISWSGAASGNGIQGYRVYRNGVLVGTTTNTHFYEAGLAAGTTYAYTVRTLNTSGQESSASTTLNVTTAAATLQVFTPLAQ